MRRISIAVVLSLLGAASMWAQGTAQNTTNSDQSSLGDYARKIRKDTGAKVTPKVFDNDNLPREEKLSVIGDKTAATEAEAKPPANDDKDASGNKSASAPDQPGKDDDAKKQAEWKQWQDKLKSQKDAIDLASRELDVLQKEYQLRAAAMYGDIGNRLRNSGDWDKQDADYKQKIADKQKQVDDAKQKLEEMQEEARKAGVPSSMRE